MSLIILTKSPNINIFSFEFYKNILKDLIHYVRGPRAVTLSLISGFNDISYEYKLNPNIKDIKKTDTVFVNDSLKAFGFAIDLKKNNKIKKLIAAPIYLFAPNDFNNIMLLNEIDLILLPSEWVKDFWCFKEPKIKDKIFVWAAGVDLFNYKKDDKKYILIYQKNGDKILLKRIVNFLRNNKINYKIIKYGLYKKENYLKLLDRSKAMIYLSESETQGIALCEAWMKNVPTLVWNRGFWKFNNNTWKDDKISAPYLTHECGIFFNDFQDFEIKFNNFLINLEKFNPREYAELNFSHEVIAKQFLKLIQ